MPQVWFDQHVEISNDLSSQLYILQTLDIVAIPILFTLCAIGALMFIVGNVICFREKWEIKRKPLLLTVEDSVSS